MYFYVNRWLECVVVKAGGDWAGGRQSKLYAGRAAATAAVRWLDKNSPTPVHARRRHRPPITIVLSTFHGLTLFMGY